MKVNTKAIVAAVALLAIGALVGAIHYVDVAHAAADAGGAALAMAVVIKYGNGARDPAALKAIEAIFAAAETRQLNSRVSVEVGNSTNSLHVFGDAPADSIIDPRSAYYFGATGISDYDIGIAYPNGGAVIDLDCLVDGDDISSAGSQTLIGHGTLTAANSLKRLWEIAGLASNPGGMLSIVGTQKAGTAAAADVTVKFDFAKGA